MSVASVLEDVVHLAAKSAMSRRQIIGRLPDPAEIREDAERAPRPDFGRPTCDTKAIAAGNSIPGSR